MKKNITANSIAEAMVVMLVILTGVTWAYQMFNQSIKTVDSSEYKIRAISMAKEWLEAINNIRDTNWILFKWDLANCWNTLNYNITCFNDSGTSKDIREWSYRTYISSNNRWVLEEYTGTLDYADTSYRDFFSVGYDINWFFTQSWSLIDTEIKPPFTREIIINYIDDWNSPLYTGTNISNEEKMEVTVLIQWIDTISNQVRKVEMKNILTNWANEKTN